MKVTVALLSTVLCSVLFSTPSFAQSRPACSSAASDPDGDGYGWENNATCLVAAQPSQCEDRGGFPWGWNSTTLTSCRLDEQPAGECVDSDGDGFGWNGTDICTIEDDNFETYLGQMMGTQWRCYESEPFYSSLEQPTVFDRVLDVSFLADGVSGFTIYGGSNISAPSGPETNPGFWSRAYPIEDWELHINGRYNTSQGRFQERIVSGEWGQSKEIFIHWQSILKINNRIRSDRFDAKIYFRDSIGEYEWDLSCTGRTYDSNQGLNDNLFER